MCGAGCVRASEGSGEGELGEWGERGMGVPGWSGASGARDGARDEARDEARDARGAAEKAEASRPSMGLKPSILPRLVSPSIGLKQTAK